MGSIKTKHRTDQPCFILIKQDEPLNLNMVVDELNTRAT